MGKTIQEIIIERKIIWAEIKVLERNFRRNQEAALNLEKENKALIMELGEKLDKIQELGELVDSKTAHLI